MLTNYSKSRADLRVEEVCQPVRLNIRMQAAYHTVHWISQLPTLLVALDALYYGILARTKCRQLTPVALGAYTMGMGGCRRLGYREKLLPF